MYDKVGKFCRSCMKNEGKFNLFSTEFEAEAIAVIIEKYSGCKVSLDDQLPKSLCQRCYDQLISTHIFITNFNEVQTLLLRSDAEETIPDEKYVINTDEDIKFELPTPFSPEQLQELSLSAVVNEEVILITFDSDTIKVDEICDKRQLNDKVSTTTNQNIKYEVRTDEPNEEIRKSRKYVCNGCEQSFLFIKELREHCRSSGHDFVRRFNCNLCLRKFYTKTHYNNHMKVHKKERPHKCDACGASFTFNHTLTRHKMIHTGERPFVCKVCGKGFSRNIYLTNHMRLHNIETPLNCELCGKTYPYKYLLHQHMLQHETVKSDDVKYFNHYLKYRRCNVQCDICKKMMKKGSLYKHMKTKHADGSKAFLCSACGESFSSKFTLDAHHMNSHNTEKHECDVCSKTFNTQYRLLTHKLLHSAERPHRCDFCDMTFKHKNHLSRHMMTHTGIRSHVCKFCEKAFALKQNLQVHERIHTGERPYVCASCGRGFTSLTAKKKHEIGCFKAEIEGK